MPFYRIAGHMVHLRLSGKGAKNPPPQCRVPITLDDHEVPCCGISIARCDWDMGDGLTCDMPICSDHATEVGPDRDYCPRHIAEFKRQ